MFVLWEVLYFHMNIIYIITKGIELKSILFKNNLRKSLGSKIPQFLPRFFCKHNISKTTPVHNLTIKLLNKHLYDTKSIVQCTVPTSYALKSVEKVQKVQEEIHNVNYENILIHLVASNMFVLISMFTKNWGRNWGIFDLNDFPKSFL